MMFVSIAAAIVFLILGWLTISIVLSRVLPAERTGKKYLETRLRKLGIRHLSKNVIEEFVRNEIASAQRLAESGRQLERVQWKDWRANLVRGLDEQALHIARLLNGEEGWGGSAVAKEILQRHGLLDTSARE